jgi:5S rRNA maturation endonuclease (ribonuclease M5)
MNTELFTKLGLKNGYIKKNEYHCLCPNPAHGDQHIGNFSISLETGRMHCFSCKYSGSIIKLAQERGISIPEYAKLWNSIRKEKELYIPSVPLDSVTVQMFKNFGISQYALSRVNSKDILEEYQVFSDGNDNPVFFLLDNKKQYRAYYIRNNGNYYLIEPKTAKRDGHIFGWHLLATKYIVVTEGPFEAMAVRRATGYKAIALMGTLPSDNQIKHLRKLSNLIFAFDPDYSGRLARDTFHSNFYDTTCLFAGKYTKDLDELPDDQISQIINNSKSWLEYHEYKNKKIQII